MLIFPTHIACDAGLVHDLINVVGCNARLRCSGGFIQHFSSQPADLPHALNLLRVKHLDLMPVDEDLLAPRNAILRIIGVRYALRNFSAGRQRVDRAEVAGEGEGGEGVVVAGFWVGL